MKILTVLTIASALTLTACGGSDTSPRATSASPSASATPTPTPTSAPAETASPSPSPTSVTQLTPAEWVAYLRRFFPELATLPDEQVVALAQGVCARFVASPTKETAHAIVDELTATTLWARPRGRSSAGCWSATPATTGSRTSATPPLVELPNRPKRRPHTLQSAMVSTTLPQ